jgi:integrase
MAQHEIDPTTRMTHDAKIRLYIVPKLGDIPLMLFVREAAERLKPWQALLRVPHAVLSQVVRLRSMRTTAARDCAAARCTPRLARLAHP